MLPLVLPLEDEELSLVGPVESVEPLSEAELPPLEVPVSPPLAEVPDPLVIVVVVVLAVAVAVVVSVPAAESSSPFVQAASRAIDESAISRGDRRLAGARGSKKRTVSESISNDIEIHCITPLWLSAADRDVSLLVHVLTDRTLPGDPKAPYQPSHRALPKSPHIFLRIFSPAKSRTPLGRTRSRRYR